MRALRSVKWVLLWGSLCASGWVLGCGLTGGSIPQGDPVLSGIAITSAAPYEAVGEATVTVVTSDAKTLETTTDAEGTFELAEAAEGAVTITVTPPAGRALKPVVVESTLVTGATLYVVAAMEPSDVSYVVEQIAVTPKVLQAQVGQPAKLDFTVTGQNLTGLRPTWVVERGLGTIGGDGDFRPRRAGQGRILVQLGGKSDYAEVTVSPGLGLGGAGGWAGKPAVGAGNKQQTVGGGG